MKRLITLMAVVILGARIVASAANPGFVQENYLNSIKITFLSWVSGSTKISYERALPDWHQSSELCASLISAGYDKYGNDPLGFTLRYGHKFFIRQGDVSLKGFYLRPELIYSHYNYTCKIPACMTAMPPEHVRRHLWVQSLALSVTSICIRDFWQISGWEQDMRSGMLRTQDIITAFNFGTISGVPMTV